MTKTRHPERQRSATSEAVIGLRKALGKNQAEFAVQVMNTAVTTIARWETKNPPNGDSLLRLAKAAGQHEQFAYQDYFRGLFIDEVLKTLETQLSEPEQPPEEGTVIDASPGQIYKIPRASAGSIFFNLTRGPGLLRYRAYLLLAAEGQRDVNAAHCYLSVIRSADSLDPRKKAIVSTALEALIKARQDLFEIDHPVRMKEDDDEK